jgi:hypothetical protein
VSTSVYPLEEANDALAAIKSDAVRGAAVLQVREVRDGVRPRRGTATSTSQPVPGD